MEAGLVMGPTGWRAVARAAVLGAWRCLHGLGVAAGAAAAVATVAMAASESPGQPPAHATAPTLPGSHASPAARSAASAQRQTQTSTRARAAKRRAAAPSAASASALRDGQAEARLMDIYRLTSQGQARQALAQAEALARDYPHFHLAQLALGDLLAARARPLQQLGDVPQALTAQAPQSPELLGELRTESRQRANAVQQRPPEGSVPTQFVALPGSTRHAIAVDASRSRLYLFENTVQGLRLVADYYASVGKLGIEKTLEGDQRTPLGVYFITSRLDAATLRDFYGAGALPINYPNPLDARRGKTGSGIWLHGTPPAQFARAPQSTDGCVALANPDLERLLRTVAPRSTPVVIARQLQWAQPAAIEPERQGFEAVLAAWSAAKTQGDLRRLMGFYAADFESSKKQPLSEWAGVLEAETRALAGRNLQLKDRSYLRWTDTSDTMVVTFGEVPEGARTGPVRRQYWMRRGQQWQIFHEGVMG